MHYLRTLTCLWSLLAILVLACSSSNEDNIENGTKNDPKTENELYKMLQGSSTVKNIQTWTEKELSEGVTYAKTQVVKASERPATIYLVKMAGDATNAA